MTRHPDSPAFIRYLQNTIPNLVEPIEELRLAVRNEHLNQSSTVVTIRDRESQIGDTLIVDLVGTFIYQPNSEQIKADNLEMTLGDERVEWFFTENLLGVWKDEVKEFTVHYPLDYSTQMLAGQKVKFKATIKSIVKIEISDADEKDPDISYVIGSDFLTIGLQFAYLNGHLSEEVVSFLFDIQAFFIGEDIVDNVSIYHIRNVYLNNTSDRIKRR